MSRPRQATICGRRPTPLARPVAKPRRSAVFPRWTLAGECRDGCLSQSERRRKIICRRLRFEPRRCKYREQTSCCDLLKLSLVTRRFVRFRRTHLGPRDAAQTDSAGACCWLLLRSSAPPSPLTSRSDLAAGRGLLYYAARVVELMALASLAGFGCSMFERGWFFFKVGFENFSLSKIAASDLDSDAERARGQPGP